MKSKKVCLLLLLCTMSTSVVVANTQSAFANQDQSQIKNATSSEQYVSDLILEEGTEGDYTYLRTEEGITITKYLGKDKEIEIPETISKYPVVEIGKEAFKDNKTIESVEIKDNICAINDNAFNSCTSLKNVKLTDNIIQISSGAFRNCSSLKDFTMPKTLKYLGDNVFQDCKQLEKIVIPEGVTSIGYDFATGCTGLKEVEISSSVEKICPGAFCGCTSLRSIEIPSTVKEIQAPFQDLYHISLIGEKGSAAEKFAKAVSLPFIEKGTTEKAEEEKTLKDFEYLKNDNNVEIIKYNGEDKDVVVPDEIDGVSVTSIGNSAFKDNIKIETIKLPDSIKIINASAFESCVNLKEINIPKNTKSIKKDAFNSCKSISEIELNSKLEEIDEGAFSKCRVMEKIEIPSNVSVIGYTAFESCDNLKEINVNDKNKSFGSKDGILYLDKECTNLLKCPGGYENDTVEISKDVKYIFMQAFADNSNIKKLIFDGEEIDINTITNEVVDKILNKDEEVDLDKISLSIDDIEKISKADKNGDSYKIDLAKIDRGQTLNIEVDQKDKKDVDKNIEEQNQEKPYQNNSEAKENINSSDDEKENCNEKTFDPSNILVLSGLASIMGAVSLKLKKKH